jgi:hypothetical protein
VTCYGCEVFFMGVRTLVFVTGTAFHNPQPLATFVPLIGPSVVQVHALRDDGTSFLPR